MEQGIDLYFKPWTLFVVIQSLGILLFAVGLISRFSFWLKGQRKSLYEKTDYLMVLKAFFRYVMFQKQVARSSLMRWFIHLAIFYGFIGLLLLSAIAVLLETVVPAGSELSRYMLSGQGHNYYKAAGDAFGLLIITGLLLALVRRYIVRDTQLNTDFSDTAALVSLLLLVATGFLLEAVRISLSPQVPELRYSFIAYYLAPLFRGLAGGPSLATGLWVIHSTLNAFLLAYLPHSKFMHIINSPVEIMLNASEERMRGDLYI